MANNITPATTGTERTFPISLFNGSGDAKPKESRETWAQLSKRLSAFKIRAKKDGQLFSPARFSPKHREKKNVKELSLLALDYDHDATVAQAVETWQRQGVRFLLYTTHSHQRVTKDHPKAEDCFRVVIALAEPIPASDYPRLWEWANSVSNGRLDPSCKDASRMFYLPAKASKDAPSEAQSFDGVLLDWRKIELPKEPKPSAKSKAIEQGQFANWDALRAELGRRIVAHETTRKNGGGKYDCRGICHEGKGNTGLFYDPATNQAHCNKGCEQAAILRAFGLPEKPKFQSNNGKAANNGTATKDHSRDKNEKTNRVTNETKTTNHFDKANTYENANGGLLYWQQTKEGVVPIHLTNFGAEIVADVIEDDGTETRRAFEVEAKQSGKLLRFLVPAEDFATMKWPMVHLGAKAVIYPRRTDHARCAIQMLSASPIERRVYTHTGWREIEGEMCYLHGGGAIGVQSVKDVEVRLPDSLQAASLPEPPDVEALKGAVSAIVELTHLAADEITLPAIGAAFSAVVGNADFSFWFYGKSGSGKTELAALIQSFWGKGFRGGLKPKLPLGWESTANTMEVVGHAAKDAVCVIDDFKPVTPQHRMELYKKADRILRAQGNQIGRGRLMADLTQRKTKYPRGLIISTAEEIPRGESLLARLIVLEFQLTTIDFGQLTRLQRVAEHGVFASAMSGFIRWLATNHADKIERSSKAVERWRDYWTNRPIASHRKYATTLGHLSYAWELWLQFVQETGVMTEAEALKLRDRVLLALGIVGSKQEPHANAQNPVTRFLELLQSAFASNKAHLEHINSGSPADATNFGWRRIGADLQPCGDRIGWITSDEVYLLPDATFALLERCSASGEGIGVQQTTLWKHLHEAELLIRTKREESRRTYSAERTVNKVVVSVLRFRAEKLFKYADDADNADDASG